MPVKKVSKKKAAPRIKTQENFEEIVKEELQSNSGTPVATTMKKKRKKDTSLLDNTPTKKNKVATVPAIVRPNHTTVSISELSLITYDKDKFAEPKLSKTLKEGSQGSYVANILYRNMADFLKREQFYLTSLNGSDKTKMKASILKDMNMIKAMIKEM